MTTDEERNRKERKRTGGRIIRRVSQGRAGERTLVRSETGESTPDRAQCPETRKRTNITVL